MPLPKCKAQQPQVLVLTRVLHSPKGILNPLTVGVSYKDTLIAADLQALLVQSAMTAVARQQSYSPTQCSAAQHSGNPDGVQLSSSTIELSQLRDGYESRLTAATKKAETVHAACTQPPAAHQQM